MPNSKVTAPASLATLLDDALRKYHYAQFSDEYRITPTAPQKDRLAAANEARQKIEALFVEVEANDRRYRWLRDNSDASLSFARPVRFVTPTGLSLRGVSGGSEIEVRNVAAFELDAAIDAALTPKEAP